MPLGRRFHAITLAFNRLSSPRARARPRFSPRKLIRSSVRTDRGKIADHDIDSSSYVTRQLAPAGKDCPPGRYGSKRHRADALPRLIAAESAAGCGGVTADALAATFGGPASHNTIGVATNHVLYTPAINPTSIANANA